MTFSPSTMSRFRMLALLPLAAITLSACTSAPAPEPTPTSAFASEEEAFAAAEETYRAYNDALNELDVSDTSTYETVFSFTSGDFEAADRKSLSELHAEDRKLQGETTVTKFKGITSKEPYDEVVAMVCLDVSKFDVIDASGSSVVPPERSDINALTVTFRLSDDSLSIDHAERLENTKCIDS